MEDRRKIVIPFGHEPETPHFDAEETLLSARPVVPITQAETTPVFKYEQAELSSPFYKHPAFLSLIVMAAVGLGLAAGLGIARYRYMQRNAAAPVVAQPAPVINDTHTAATSSQPAEGNEQAQAPALPAVKTEETTTVDDTAKGDNARTAATEDSKDAKERSAEKKDEDKDDKAKTTTTTSTTPSATREKKRTTEEDEDGENLPRAQRRERRVRDRGEDPADIPRRIERASQQINRIREIFEGRP